jgi:glutamate transport system substrate-binding protein
VRRAAQPARSESDFHLDRRSVNVGVRTDEPGFGNLIRGTNDREGFDVDLYRWLSEHVSPKFTPVPVDLTAEERERALQDGTVQLIVETYAITDPRRKFVGFAGPYMLSREGIMVRATDKRIHTISDLPGKTVCTLSSSTADIEIRDMQLYHQINLISEPAFSTCVDLLIKGDADAVSTDQIILTGFTLDDPAHLSVVQDLTFGPQDRLGVGLPHGDTADCIKVADALKEFIISGEWDVFFTEHFPRLPHAQYKPDPNKLDRCE